MPIHPIEEIWIPTTPFPPTQDGGTMMAKRMFKTPKLRTRLLRYVTSAKSPVKKNRTES